MKLALPDELLSRLVSFLYIDDLLSLERASHSWRRTLAIACFWTYAKFDHQWSRSECASTLVNLLAMRHGPHVKMLTLIGCAIPEGSLVKTAKYFTSLTHLTVSGCLTLADIDFSAIIQASSQQLIEVRAVKCLRLTDHALQAIDGYHSQSLDLLDFSYCRQISSNGLEAVICRCKNLRSIRLKGSPAVTSSVVTCIAKSCPKVETLLVGGATNLNDDCLLALGTHCPNLTALDISRSNPFGCSRGGISDYALEYLVLRCPRLQHLAMGGQGRLKLSVINSLAKFCPKLETLDIGGCRNIVSNPIELGAELKRLRGLNELSVALIRELKEAQVHFIASQCPQLKLVEFTLPRPELVKMQYLSCVCLNPQHTRN